MARDPKEGTRQAAELMTAWLDAPDGPPDRFVDCLRSHIEENPTQEPLVAAVELIMGMTHLSGALLVLAEETTGIPAREVLMQFAELYGGV